MKLIRRDSFLVAVSGYDGEKEKNRCFQSGFDAFITKPIEYETILDFLNK